MGAGRRPYFEAQAMSVAVTVVLRCCPIWLLLSALAAGQCSDGSCSAICLPDQSERELCIFYVELEDWRSTAVRCGLMVPALAGRDGTRPVLQQWEAARDEWNMIRRIWEEATRERGVLVGQISESMSGSGEVGDLEEVWRREVGEWQDQYIRWHQSEMVATVTPLPSGQLDSGDWTTLLERWTTNFVAYNTTYRNTCQL